ncbi:MAG: IucA/IucC family protein [Halalkalicoccus sp.]
MNPDGIASEAAIHAYLNCYLRETGDGEVVELDDPAIDAGIDRAIACELPERGIELLVPLAYRSPTGRHRFALPGYYRAGGERFALDLGTLAALTAGSIARSRDAEATDELLYHVLDSRRAIERFVRARAGDDRLDATEWTFRDAEQSLVFGHLLHPTPKSREGIAPHDAQRYAPELRGSFPLSYVRADPALLEEGSAREERASAWVRGALRDDPHVPDGFCERHADDALVPLHPWQADHLRRQPRVRRLIEDDEVAFLGEVGRPFYPTSSVRTLYAPDAPFMVKGSLAVRITNSVRTNKRLELERGVAVAELLDAGLAREIDRRFPDFEVVRDPAYLTLGGELTEGEESGFEVVFRENPFRDEDAENVAPVVDLCQDGIDGPSRLARLVEEVAAREGVSTADAAEEWFRRYLATAIRPVLWLYLAYGIGLEAHQQNAVLSVEEGYPDGFYYRDNQGYYFAESTYPAVDDMLPGVGARADTLVSDAVADERIRYYVVLNNAFGVINALGTAGFLDERRLLSLLREELESLREFDRPESSLLESLLAERRLPCKANLLTRAHGMDELVGELETQSVYTDVPNPLVTELEAHV